MGSAHAPASWAPPTFPENPERVYRRGLPASPVRAYRKGLSKEYSFSVKPFSLEKGFKRKRLRKETIYFSELASL
jgi:hypothetical protein